MDIFIQDSRDNVELDATLVLDITSKELYDIFQFETAIRWLPMRWRGQVMSKKRETDRHRALCNKLLQLFGCSVISGTPVESLRFGTIANGKPILQDNNNMSFSMSNGNNYVVMYVNRTKNKSYELGVDIASRDDLADSQSLSLLKDIFHDVEYTTLSHLSSDQLSEMSAYYWSFKESYTKYTGTGILCDLVKINAGKLTNFSTSQTIDRLVEGNLMTFHSYWLEDSHQEIVTICKLRNKENVQPKIYKVSLSEMLTFFK